ncbi:hypothetical protein [Salipiger mucosus]|uniref:Uncharacterized protein n=1 Tax=Salipiger mucosus DSM 16094 TaxID=1123237 RepID=S9RIM4_9RHOB|nr:hypothetical protein [Salipiger mucosus]EPX77970.1 hypothetical protein Salmuc_03292 [Salipiger mucosus DSM 16094]
MTTETSGNFETAAFFTFLLTQEGYSEIRDLEDGRFACLLDLMFTTAIIVGRIGDTSGYDDRWCYKTYEMAKDALTAWDGVGEPDGWHRHPLTGRRREFDDLGELTREYVTT